MSYRSGSRLPLEFFVLLRVVSRPGSRPPPVGWLVRQRHALEMLVLLGIGFAIYAPLAEGKTELSQLRIEIPLVTALSLLIYAGLRPGRVAAAIACLPLLSFYLWHDACLQAFDRPLRFADFALLPEVFDVLAGGQLVAAALAIALPPLLILYRLDWKRWRRVAALYGAVALVLTLPATLPGVVPAVVDRLSARLSRWHDGLDTRYNGRLTMLLYRESHRQQQLAQLASHLDDPVLPGLHRAKVDALEPYVRERDVHLIVLESFFDPLLFENLELPRDPAHPDYRELARQGSGLIASPVFGGRSAQAEFEILCGVKAHGEFGAADFMAFSGAPSYCLPGLLGELGYRTVVTNSYKPDYFNSTAAYRSVGFQEIHFPQEYSGGEGYLSVGATGAYVFDGELFQQNLDFVDPRRTSGRPVFNYVVGMYGHDPHELEGRPALFESLPGVDEDQAVRAINQFHHRSAAVAELIRRVMREDPESVVIVTSDHLPPFGGEDTYRKLGYLGGRIDALHLNLLLVAHRGRMLKLDELEHRHLPDLILDLVSDGAYCARFPCYAPDDDFEVYAEVVAHGMR